MYRIQKDKKNIIALSPLAFSAFICVNLRPKGYSNISFAAFTIFSAFGR
jgi:hypothetical protein